MSKPTGDLGTKVQLDIDENREIISIPTYVKILCVSILCLLLFQSITPAESYLHEYLEKYKHIVKQEMHRNIWPMYTYAHFAALIPITIAAERFVHYPPIIIFSILLRISSSFIHEMTPEKLIWPHQLSLALFGVACAGKVAFRSFAYSVLPTRVYFAMTSYMKGFNSAAHVAGGLIGWLLKRSGARWSTFFRIQQACLITALLSFLIGLYVAYISHQNTNSSKAKTTSIFSHDQVQSPHELFHLIRSLYSSGNLLTYSVWIIIAGAAFEVIMMNATTLFHTIDETAKENGLVFGAGKFIAATITIYLGKYSAMLERNGFIILMIMSWLTSAALLTSYLSTHISTAYISFLLICISYDICFCISMTLIATSVPTSVRGIVIFCNTAFSLAIQTAIQGCLRLLLFDVFQYYLSLTVIFAMISIFLHVGHSGIRHRSTSLAQ